MIERPMDGDIIITHEGYIYYTFGYMHPKGHIIAFLKYIPEEKANLFKIPLESTVWTRKEKRLVRPKPLYTPEIYNKIFKTLEEHYPDYIIEDIQTGYKIIAVPKDEISEYITPREALNDLLERPKNQLAMSALQAIMILVEYTGLSFKDFGLKGSLALRMATPQSDIDLTVIGGENYRKVHKILPHLGREGITVLEKDPLNRFRKDHLKFWNRRVTITAQRHPNEVKRIYGEYKFKPIGFKKIKCKIIDDSEAIFRPAYYKVESEENITEVVSMNGAYRNIARKGEEIIVQGTIEEVTHKGESWKRIVVGSRNPKGVEYIWPVKEINLLETEMQ